MKKILSFSLALMLLLGVLAVPAMAETKTCGVLSYLNMKEEETSAVSLRKRPLMALLFLSGVLDGDSEWLSDEKSADYRYFDSMNDLLMALQSGTVDAIKVPYYMAAYLCATNDGLQLTREYHPEKASGASEYALARISDGYSFMMKEENAELRDAFDEQIAAMKEDGTLQKLIDEHIIQVAEGGEPVPVDFDTFEGDPIRIAVTGSLPPMDYVAPDGTFAGFNTAVLAELGRRLQKNFELVQVDSIGRSLALSEGTVDVVFWTRAFSEKIVDSIVRKRGLSDEELAAQKAASDEALTDEEKAILADGKEPDGEELSKLRELDMPPGTIITRPYFSDFPVWVVLKEAE